MTNLAGGNIGDMPDLTAPELTTPQLFLSRMAEAVHADRDLRRAYERGEYVRILPGVFVRKSDYAQLNYDARYRLRVQAAARHTPGTQFSHDSAAVMLRMPTTGPWSKSLHALAPRADGGRSTSLVSRHCVDLDASPLEIDGVTVTSLARTAVDIAASQPSTRAVGMVDDALRQPDPQNVDDVRARYGIAQATKAEMHAILDAQESARGKRKAATVIDFADGSSGSVFESRSRAAMHLLGIPAPLLQVPFYDEDGLIGYVDFYWPDLNVIGEADGFDKYRNPKFLRGRTPEQALRDEKDRENRLRRQGPLVARWDPPILSDLRRFVARLAPFGIRPTR
ncbi:hypothetical protein [Salinibacterium sp. ZJ450]|uniref:hypothetical protein n=1 Tax=Salinibacterium sp. ZJ450 TaxID=2708338 RepID=UPI0014200185|nr:hypothetical protein [Salinibacterium sp. ZJ450]